MIILGHPKIPSPALAPAKTIEEIAATPAGSVALIPFDLDLLRYCSDNDVRTAVHITEVAQSVYANALGATYLFCELELAKKVQKIAENYLFDSKVIAIIDERLIHKAIEAGIDGVLLRNYTRDLWR